MKILALLIAFGSFLLQCESPDDTFYVDVDHPQASNSNPGTQNRPWRTIVHAAATARAGDTVLVKAGVCDHGEIEIANRTPRSATTSAGSGRVARSTTRRSSCFRRGASS